MCSRVWMWGMREDWTRREDQEVKGRDAKRDGGKGRRKEEGGEEVRK